MRGFEKIPEQADYHAAAQGEASRSWNALKDTMKEAFRSKDIKRAKIQADTTFEASRGGYFRRIKELDNQHREFVKGLPEPYSPELDRKLRDFVEKRHGEAFQLHLSQYESIKDVGKKANKEVDDINTTHKNKRLLERGYDRFSGKKVQQYNEAARIAEGNYGIKKETHEEQWDKLAKKQEEDLTRFGESLSGGAARTQEKPIESDNPFDDSHAIKSAVGSDNPFDDPV